LGARGRGTGGATFGSLSEGNPIEGRATFGSGSAAGVNAGVRRAITIGLTYSTPKASKLIPTSQ
jgi:hypothetical protein